MLETRVMLKVVGEGGGGADGALWLRQQQQQSSRHKLRG